MPALSGPRVGVTVGTRQRKGLEERRAERRPLLARRCPWAVSGAPGRPAADADTFMAGGLATEAGHTFSVKAEGSLSWHSGAGSLAGDQGAVGAMLAGIAVAWPPGVPASTACGSPAEGDGARAGAWGPAR